MRLVSSTLRRQSTESSSGMSWKKGVSRLIHSLLISRSTTTKLNNYNHGICMSTQRYSRPCAKQNKLSKMPGYLCLGTMVRQRQGQFFSIHLEIENHHSCVNKYRVEIISTTAHQLEQGYDKLSRWCSSEFRQYVRDAQLEVGPLMREVIRWLKNRSELLT